MNPNDTYFPEQWALTHLDAPAAWDCVDPNAPEVIVAVVDSGVADNHEDLQTRLLTPDTVINILSDDDDHGTLVAGAIGALTDNARGIAGAAKGKVQILPIKFCSAQCWPDPELGAIAIRRAADFEPLNTSQRVIVLAWDVGYTTDALREAIEHAGSKDAVVVVAAGNHSLDNDRYPNWPANHGDMVHVITVMATDQHDERASFSNFGKTTVHIAAPGVGLLSTAPYYGPLTQGSIRTGYRTFGGTTGATAYVAGLAALLRSKHPNWTAAQVKTHVLAKKRPVPGLAGLCVAGGIADYALALCA